MNRILVATPTIDGRIDVRFLTSLISTMRTYPELAIEPKFICGDAFLGRARDQLLQFAIDAKADSLVWIDSDTYWTPADFMAIANSPYDYIGGIQRHKTTEPTVPIITLPNRVPDASGVLEVAGIGFALTKMSSPCFKTLYEGATAYESQGKHLRRVFDTPIVDGILIGEDFACCNLWRNLGGRVFAHTGVKLGHVGAGITFDFTDLSDPDWGR